MEGVFVRKETITEALLSLSPLEILEVMGIESDPGALVELLSDYIDDHERAIDRELVTLGLLDPEGEDYD